MPDAIPFDDALAQRLPLPLAQLYRRAHNAKTGLGLHQAAYYLWEAALKLLGSTAVVEYADLGDHDPKLAGRLQNLARPSLGHWWEFVRRLLPVLAEAGDPHFARARDLVLGRARDDLPRAAGLDAALREVLEGKGGARSTVRLSELFDRLVRYRNQEMGHGAAGQRPAAFYEALGRALLAGVADVLGRLDVLAGRRLLYVAEVRQAAGLWLVQRYELAGESPRRVAPLELPHEEAARLPYAEQLYLEAPAPKDAPVVLRPLHPLLAHDAEAEEVLFLNARRGRQRAEYLSYTTGRVVDRPDLGAEQRQLQARVQGLPVREDQAERWAARSQAEEAPDDPAGGAREPPGTRRVGEFELLTELGRGGMGVVYRAWQPSLGRQVALKCMLRTGDARTEARFAREIRALGRVEHPHLVKIFTSGSEGDQWFYAMELVEGAPLAAVCDRLQARTASVTGVDLKTWQETLSTVCAESRRAEKPLSDPQPELPPPQPPGADPAPPDRAFPLPGRGYVGQIVELVRQVAEAAEALHGAGVVHRDIKPGNVLLTADGAQAVLMDLGLAQLADEADGRLTRSRQFVGTLRYASPEQVLAVARVDRRSDVYGLGATLWELLALRPLFGATDLTPTPELMLRIQYEEPQRLRKHHPGIPRDLEAIVHRCLEKDPRQRYPTARELAEDLGRFLAGEPVQARPIRGWERALKWVRRRPGAAALLGISALAVLALVALAVGLFYNARLQDANARLQGALSDLRDSNTQLQQSVLETDEQRREADRQRAEAQQQKAEADRQRDEAHRQRARAERLQYAADMTLAARQEGQVPLLLELLERHRPRRRGDADLRQFEWHYLWRLCHAELANLAGHANVVHGLAFSPDGRRLASAGGDRTVKVWDVFTGQEALTLRGHAGIVWGVAFSPDGKRLASAGGDRMVRVWDAATGQEIRALKGHTDAVLGAAFSPDGRRLASASWDKTVRVWDTATGQAIHVLQGHTDFALAVAFSPDGTRLASAGKDRTVRLWDPAAGRPVLSLHGHTRLVSSVAFSPDGRRLASGSEDRAIKLWDPNTGKEIRTIWGEDGLIYSVAFSPDGRYLASGNGFQTVKVLDAATGQEVLTFRGRGGRGFVYSVAFSPDGTRLASGGEGHTVEVWDATTPPGSLALHGHTDEINGVAFSPDGRRLASAGGDRTVRVWDVAAGHEVLCLQGHTASVESVVFSPDGRRLASASFDRTVRVWDAATGREVLRLRGHADHPVTSVAFSPDGRRLASASWDRTVRVWDATTGQELRALRGHTDDVRDVAFSPDGKHLASASRDKTVRVWDVSTGREVLSLQGDTIAVYCVAFSPDGKRLASGGVNKVVRVWDVATGREVLSLRGHTSTIFSVAFSPDGRRLASGCGYEQAVKVWEAATGQEVLSLKGSGEVGVRGVAFSPDGTRLASAGNDRTVRVWDAATRPEPLSLRGHTDAVARVAFDPDGKRLASAGYDGTVRLWDVAAGLEILSLPGHPEKVRDLACSPDGKRLALAGADGTVRVWDAATGQPLRSLKGHTAPVLSTAFGPGGRLASGSSDKTVRVWDADSGREVLTLTGHADSVLGVAFSRDGRRLASASQDQTVRVWDAATGRELHVLRGHTSKVWEVAFSPDGKRLASAGEDKTVRVWDVATGQQVLCLQGHTDAIDDVAFSPDGKRLATAGADRTVRVWDAATGRELAALRGHARGVVTVAFSPDGTRLASGSYDRTIRIWPAEPPKPEDQEARYRAHQKRSLAWDRHQAAECERGESWFGAIFHLDRLLGAGDSPGPLYARRAVARAHLGRLDEATADMAKAVHLAPEEPANWSQYAVLCLQRDDLTGYRETCARMVDRFGQAQDPRAAVHVACACMLLPDAVSDPDRVVRIMETALARDPKRPEHFTALGIALYRAGRWEEAVQRLGEGVRAAQGKGDAYDWLFLAMAHHRLGHAAEAKKYLGEAVRWADAARKEKPAGSTTSRKLTWNARVTLERLRREAEALLAGQPR